jgi:hypothetical protein
LGGLDDGFIDNGLSALQFLATFGGESDAGSLLDNARDPFAKAGFYDPNSAIAKGGVSTANNVTADLPFALFDNATAAAEETLSAADVLAQRGTMIGEAGNSSGVRVVNSEAELNNIFAELSKDGTPVVSSYPGRMVQLPNGIRIGIRQTSTSGGPTVDIIPPGGKGGIKIHLNQ